MRLNKEIESDHPDVFGTFRIEHAVQNFLEKFKSNTETLFEWIQSTRGGVQRIGPWLGTNAVNLLIRISPDYLAGKDLSDTTLTKATLFNADLRGTKLENAQLSGVSLVDARFFRRDIAFSRIDNAYVSLHVLKTREFSNDNFFEYVFDKFEEDREAEVWPSSFRDDLLWQIDIKVKDIKDLEFLRDELSLALSTKVAIYYEECEELAREQDSAKSKRKPRASPKA